MCNPPVNPFNPTLDRILRVAGEKQSPPWLQGWPHALFAVVCQGTQKKKRLKKKKKKKKKKKTNKGGGGGEWEEEKEQKKE